MWRKFVRTDFLQEKLRLKKWVFYLAEEIEENYKVVGNQWAKTFPVTDVVGLAVAAAVGCVS